MSARVLFNGMEFDGKEAAAIVNSAEALARSLTKLAEAVTGVKKELSRIGDKNALFYAELLRAAHIADYFGVEEKRFHMSARQAQTLKECFSGDLKIQAIKVIREATGMDLKDAKDMVDKYWGGMRGGVNGILGEFSIDNPPAF